jgi:predicted glycogen debranching enzyme
MKLPTIVFTQEALSHFDEFTQKEWLITNGLGGYASSTVLGLNTRKYHGLLVAALHPPGDRTVCLAKLDEEVCVGNNIYPLGANEFRDKIFPQGYMFLKEFSVSPFPRYVYSIEDVRVGKTVFMPNGRNAAVVIYNVRNTGNSEAEIRVYPLLNFRHFHTVVDRWRNPLNFSQKQNGREVETTFTSPKGTLMVSATEGTFTMRTNWIERIHYREEVNRGESSIDDCFQPGYYNTVVPPKRENEFAIIAAADENSQKTRDDLDAVGTKMYDVLSVMKNESERREKFLDNFYSVHRELPANEWLNWILLTTDTFMVKSGNSKPYVIAGYHWFEPWGRDTFISLPGLMLVTGRFEDARKVISEFGDRCKHGLIPDFVDDRSGEPSYNTVDATLWYINAVLQYLKYTSDFKFVQKQLWENLQAIIEYHEKGTGFGIRLDSDGLIVHGPRLTWMDAEYDGVAVTPRAGKAVEIQALWYNALRIMELLAIKFGEKNLAEKYSVIAGRTQESFNGKFWNASNNCLFDVLGESGADASLRPNQIIAAGLDFPVMADNRNGLVVDLVQREFLTPYGLRSLARSDPKYRGVYVGDRRSRDQAYHNGAVWPWLLGSFARAFFKAKGYLDYRVEYALNTFIAPLFTQQIYAGALGTLSEIYDGEPPYAAKGCVSQAWSVAEPLRAYVEDVMRVRPEYEKEVLQA